MKTNKLLIILSAISLLFGSCGNKEKHDRALRYYVTVNANINNLTADINSYWHLLSAQVKYTGSLPEKKLDQLNLDTLRFGYNETMAEIDDVIDTLNMLPEVDENLNIKKMVIRQLEEVKIIQSNAIPQTIQFLENGLAELSTQQIEALYRSRMQSSSLERLILKLHAAGQEFRLAHNITDEELNKFGL
jgi:hypothetical protein